MCFDPREDIHEHLKNAASHVRQAGRIAQDVGDSSGAQELKELEESVEQKADEFDKKAM